MSDWELDQPETESSDWELTKPSPKSFDKLKAASMLLPLMAGNPVPLGMGALKSAASDIPDFISNAYNTFSQGINGSPKQPFRDIGAGLVDIPTSMINSLMSAPEQAAKIGIIPEGYTLPKIPSISRKGENPTDKLLRALVGNSPILFGGIKATPKAVRTTKSAVGDFFGGGGGNGGGGISSVIGKSNPALMLKAGKLESELESQASTVERAKQLARDQLNAHHKIVGEAKKLTNIADENKIEFALNKQKSDIEAAKEKSNELFQKLESIEPAPEEPIEPEQKNITPPEEKNITPPEYPNVTAPEEPQKTSGEHVVAAEKAADEASNFENTVQKAKEHHENVSKLDENANEAIGEHLNIGSAHHLHVGRFLKTEIGGIEKEGSTRFKALKENIKDSKFEMPNVLPFKIDMDSVLRQLNAGKDPKKLSSPVFDNHYLKSMIEKAPTSKDTMASDFISKYQDWRDYRFELKDSLKEVGPIERKQIIEALKNSEEIDGLIRKTLNDGLGPFKKEWDKVNELYSKVIYPLRSNSVAKDALKDAKISKANMAEQLAGDEPGSNVLREIIKGNQEATKHVVGQRYEVGASKVHNPNEILTEYTDKLPQLNEMLKNKKSTEAMKEEAQSHLEKAKQHHEKLKTHAKRLSNASVRAGKEESRIYKEYSERKRAYDKEISSYEKDKKKYELDLKAQEKERKEYESKLSSAEKERESYKSSKDKYDKELKDREYKVRKAEQNIENHKKNIDKMESRVEILEDQMNKVRESADRKNISLEAKFKEEQKFSNLKKELKSLNQDISKSTTGLKKALFIAKTVYKVGLKLNKVI